MRMSALFGAKKLRIFQIYGVFARTKGKGVEPVRKFFGQWGKGGSIFRGIVRTSFIDGP